MNREIGKEWKVYHLTQPYFFAHHHFHLRKIHKLRSTGINAQLLALVPKKLYLSNEKQYREAEREGLTKIIVLPSERLYFIYLICYLLMNIVRGNKVLVHVLRSSTWPIIFLRHIPFIKNKVRLVQEFEGDSISEINYSKSFDPSYIENKPFIQKLKKIKLSAILKKEVCQVREADGIVLMSNEHVALWQSRLNKQLSTLILPTLPEPKGIVLDENERDSVRDNLDVKNNLVIVYVGNIVSPWQRRDDMCEFISDLRIKIPNIKFLALVRKDDIPLMKHSICKYGINDVAIVKSVPHSEVYKYLSAADLALFLRHDHTMNNIVTSGKLGEYLCAGLPVITTGNNAEVLNDFIKRNTAGVFINEDLGLTLNFINELRGFKNIKMADREKIRNKFIEEFASEDNCFEFYPEFIRNIMIGERK